MCGFIPSRAPGAEAPLGQGSWLARTGVGGGRVARNGGAPAFMGIMPSWAKIVAAVREKLTPQVSAPAGIH